MDFILAINYTAPPRLPVPLPAPLHPIAVSCLFPTALYPRSSMPLGTLQPATLTAANGRSRVSVPATTGQGPAAPQPSAKPRTRTHPSAAAVPRLRHVLRHLVALVEADGHRVADRHVCGRERSRLRRGPARPSPPPLRAPIPASLRAPARPPRARIAAPALTGRRWPRIPGAPTSTNLQPHRRRRTGKKERARRAGTAELPVRP